MAPNYSRPGFSQPKKPLSPEAASTEPVTTFQGNTFTLNLPDEGWQDRTIYTFTGPLDDDFQHTVTVSVDPEAEVEALLDYADVQIRVLETKLKGWRLLLKEKIKLNNGLPAYRTVAVWYPAEDLRLYLEQLYVLHQQTGYIVTATFTKKTRETLGPKVERMMLGFEPVR